MKPTNSTKSMKKAKKEYFRKHKKTSVGPTQSAFQIEIQKDGSTIQLETQLCMLFVAAMEHYVTNMIISCLSVKAGKL